MARIALLGMAVLAVLALAGCSQNDAGRKVITDRCVADSGIEPVCKCLADESSSKLDPDMFSVVVTGAQGDQKEADLQLSELTKERQLLFGVLVEEVRRACEAAEAAPAN